MSEKKVALILNHIAEQAAPGAEINLWPALQGQLQTSTLTYMKGSKMDTRITSSHRLRIAALITLSIALLVGLLLATPQGQAWAQSLLHFFTRSGDTLPLPTSQPASLAAVTPGVQQPTLTPTARPTFVATCGVFLVPECSLSQIRGMVNFTVKALADIPQDMSFIGATGGPGEVYLFYRRSDRKEGIILDEGPGSKDALQPWKVADSATVETVPIGDLTGEYVKGSWNNFQGDKSAMWDSTSSIQTLRWEEKGILMTIRVWGNPQMGNQVINKGSMVQLAQAMTTSAVSSVIQPTVTPASPYLSVSEAEKQAGFAVIEPTWLPDGYQFDHALYVAQSKTICIDFKHTADVSDDSLTIAESISLPPAPLIDLFPDAPQMGKKMETTGRGMITTSLTVGGAADGKGTYAGGFMKLFCELQPSAYGSSYQDQVLQVQMDNKVLMIFSRKDSFTKEHNFLTRQQMVRLAESITGVHTIAENQLDPEYITTPADGDKLAGFHIKLVTELPAGVSFDHISYTQDGSVTQITTIYTGNETGNDVAGNPINKRFDVTLTIGASENLDQIYSKDPGIYSKITVWGNEGLITQGVWDVNGFVSLENGGDGGMSLIWFDHGIKYMISGFNAYSKADWLQIAESMK